MSKLPEQHKFIDVSDYGRTAGRFIAKLLVPTRLGPIDVTTLFVIAGLLAVTCIINGYFIAAAFFIILKSILDAADGELSRLQNTPSYTGRYYDSIADLVLNILFLFSITFITNGSYIIAVIAFLGLQLQGTLYNYYYLILRTNLEGDTTSRIFETETPVALEGESQRSVTLFYKGYVILYRGFDIIIHYLDKDAIHGKSFPKWFMTSVSVFGLGFQLLVMALMMVLGLAHLIIPVILISSFFILFFIGIRKFVLK